MNVCHFHFRESSSNFYCKQPLQLKLNVKWINLQVCSLNHPLYSSTSFGLIVLELCHEQSTVHFNSQEFIITKLGKI